MAAYYDYIPGAVQWRTPALDPSNECGTFLSYKLTDWVNKIGPNYAQIWTNHEEWAASDRYVNGQMTSDDDAYIQVRLPGRDYRAGTLSGTGIEPWFGLYIRKIGSNGRLGTGLITKPVRIDTQLDYTRNNLVRNSYGHINSFTAYNLSETYYLLQNADFISPRITRVLYSDTPGNRYFAWQINGNTAIWSQGVIYEMQVREDLPPGSDVTWALTNGFNWHSLTNYDAQNFGDYRFYYNSTGVRVKLQYAAGYPVSETYAKPVYSSAPAIDYHGDVIGTCENFLYGSNVFEQNFTYRVGGKKYFAWTDSFLLPID